MDAIGRKRWAIAEGYIPSESSFSHRALVSHETACILNAGDRDAHVTITIFFADRDPVGPYRLTVAGTPDARGMCDRSRSPRSGAYGTAPPGQERLVLGHELLGRVETAPAERGRARRPRRRHRPASRPGAVPELRGR